MEVIMFVGSLWTFDTVYDRNIFSKNYYDGIDGIFKKLYLISTTENCLF